MAYQQHKRSNVYTLFNQILPYWTMMTHPPSKLPLPRSPHQHLKILTANQSGPPDPILEVAEPTGTGPHRWATPGQPNQADLLDDEAGTDEETAGQGQRQSDVEVLLFVQRVHWFTRGRHFFFCVACLRGAHLTKHWTTIAKLVPVPISCPSRRRCFPVLAVTDLLAYHHYS